MECVIKVIIFSALAVVLAACSAFAPKPTELPAPTEISVSTSTNTPTETPLVLNVGSFGEYTRIQDAINAALFSRKYVIQVAQGTYTENIIITGNKDILLQGGWTRDFTSRSEKSSLTIIDGMAKGSVFDIDFGDGNDITLGIEGFTIRNGRALTEWQGGGMSIEGSGVGSKLMLTLADNIISENDSASRGGGIFMDASNSASLDAILINNTIADNTTGKEGGGLRISSALGGTTKATLIKNTITSNVVRENVDGGGLAAYAQTAGKTSLLLENNIIATNESGFGGGILGYAWQTDALLDITLTNNIIADNTARMMGGAIFSCAGATDINTQPGGTVYWKLTNNTITQNTATTIGDGVTLYSGSTFGDGGLISLSSRNDIIWGNTDPHKDVQLDVIIEDGRAGVATANVAYSDIGSVETRGGGTYTLENGIDGDPLFVDPVHQLFLLQGNSPAVDKGDPIPTYNDGHRPPGKGTERADIGAYGGPNNDNWP